MSLRAGSRRSPVLPACLQRVVQDRRQRERECARATRRAQREQFLTEGASILYIPGPLKESVQCVRDQVRARPDGVHGRVREQSERARENRRGVCERRERAERKEERGESEGYLIQPGSSSSTRC